jgi:HEPN domain-containing protein
MDDLPLPDAQAWLTKAWHDLETARLVANAPAPFLDVAIYHCQQAAEKTMKGFLVHHGRVVVRTHDIEVLVDIAAEIEPAMHQLADAADVLTPYASRFRYPNAAFALEPMRDEFDEALCHAQAIYDFVLQRLPEAVRTITNPANP